MSDSSQLGQVASVLVARRGRRPLRFLLVAVCALLSLLVVAPARAVDPPFHLAWSSSAPAETRSVAWGDYDGDGDLDLLAGNARSPSRLYRNDGGTLTTAPVWSSEAGVTTTSVAWGDYDGDGDLDVATGNDRQPTRLYRNDGGVLSAEPIWSSEAGGSTTSIAWGDYDGDADLDLVVGNEQHPTWLYRNDGGVLTGRPVWSSQDTAYTTSVAWGDYDGDGDLDLAVGNYYQPTQLHRNEGGRLTTQAVWSLEHASLTTSVAWGDYDGDGDLDLVLGSDEQPTRLYRNDGGVLALTPAWSAATSAATTSVAWGDYDADGDLDLVAGSRDQPTAVYRNDAGTLTAGPAWSLDTVDATLSLAWADYDGDGDLDLAAGNRGAPTRLYRNDGTALPTAAAWSLEHPDLTTCIAWADYDRDGDQDLVVGNDGSPTRLYRNDQGLLTGVAVWSSKEAASTQAVAWGDYDRDGDLDLVIGNVGQPNRLYRNDDGILTTDAVWSSDQAGTTTSLAWGDYDGDRDLDLVVGNRSSPNQLYRNDGGTLTTTPVWSSRGVESTRAVALGDYDGDGDLDLAVGNYNQPTRLYNNNAGTLDTIPAWTSREVEPTKSLAWGDYDGDRDLDLVVGNDGTRSWLYRNDGGTLNLDPVWSSERAFSTTSVAWGDYDRDGDLDLVLANRTVPSRLYRNDGGQLSAEAVWSSGKLDYSTSAAWGDYDGDGDLDLALGNYYQPNRIYRTDAGALTSAPVRSIDEADLTIAVAWGDYDSDGDLDLAAGNDGSPTRLYRNEGGKLATSPVWSSNEAASTSSIAWGDYDGDGDLDLVIGNRDEPNRLYRNDRGTLSTSAVWSSEEVASTRSVAWGDYDGDGDLDLAAGNDLAPTWLYRNDGGQLTPRPVWRSEQAAGTRSVAWGDYDGDGDLDLVVGNVGSPTRLYRNEGGTLARRPVWSSQEAASTTSVAWGDYDGDGDLDLLLGNRDEPNQLYRNDAGRLTASPVWSSREVASTRSVAWSDYDGDGDLDLAVGNDEQPVRLYRNDEGVLATSATWTSTHVDLTRSLAWGDVDGDGDLDLAAGNYLGIRLYLNARDHRLGPAAIPRLRIARPEPAPAADFYSSATILSGPAVPIRYWLLDRDSGPVKSIRAFYSLDGGGHWQPAIAAADTLTANLETSPGGTPHTYTWDLYASGVMGQSDNVVFRLEAVPAITGAPHGVAGPFQFGASAADTFPFRVRGSQVRVLSDTIPMPNALVYRLTGRETVGGKPYADLTGEPFRTDSQGYLQGRGRVRLGDRLVALLPVHHSRSYELYYTSAAPVESGLRAYPVRAGGVQTLTVSAANPLLLFNLDVALEWDARRDTQYLSQLTFDLQRASAFLYDWSDGQVALGALRVFPDARHNHYDRETPSTPGNTVLAESPPAEWDAWLNAHVRIYATNRLRPNAAQGGIVDAPLSDPSSAGVQYEPGQVRMGAVWNRFGEPHGSLGEDWPRTLAHELGHYALFLDDNYLGLDASGLLVSIESCPGAMSDPYRDDYYSEFHPRAGWLPGCERTLSNLATGRSDWATIKSFYPWLAEPATTIDALNQGPHVLPLEITTIQTVEPLTPSQALAIPIFYLTHAGARAQTGGGARAILFQEDRLTDLGSPVLDRVEARGARPGDRLCVYDLEQARLGCETIRRGDEQLALATQPDWKPEVIVWPTAPTTISVSVTNVPPGLPLRARLFPVSDPASPAIPLRESARGYEGLFTLEQPALEGYVHVWVDGSQPLRETVADYALGAGPGYTRGRGGYTRGRGGYTRGRGAPVSSADGQVVLFDESLRLRRDDVLAVQALASIPSPPLWASPVGRAYRLSATPGLDVTGGSISFNYLGSEVLPAEEQWLAIFFWDGHEWQRLATKTDLYHNVASAPAAGAGIYALMSSIAMPLLQPGWNLFAYPVQSVRPVTEALSSIHGSYTSVYGYVVTDTLNPWRLYSPEVPDWVNDLHAFEFGKGYWIHTSHAITVQLRAPSIGSLASSDGGFANPPATYYGRVQAGPQFQPRAGQPVRAWIDGTLCGQAETREVGGELVYRIHVLAVAPGAAAGCGTPGRQVTFQVGSQWMATDVWWNNNRPWNLPLSNRMRLFIPMLE